MKRICLPAALCLLLAGCGGGEKTSAWPWILTVMGILVLAFALWQTKQYIAYAQRARKRRRKVRPLSPVTIGIYCVAAVLLLIALICGVAGGEKEPEPTQPPTIPQDRWEETDAGRRYIFADGTVATGWHTLDNKVYYFKEDGSTLHGWNTVEDINRYFRPDGSMARGEETIGGVKYFFTSTGAQVEVANPWNAVPEGYPVQLKDLSIQYAISGIVVDVKIYEPLKEMMDACNAALVEMYGSEASKCCVTSGYRTMEEQTNLYDTKVTQLMNSGYSREAAEQEAATAVATPGTSEHQLGLAADIVDTGSWDLESFQEDLPAQQWLMENCWQYGFILRYPEGKTDVTGIIYEPWHYRYVGKDLALELHTLGLTLEEYLAALD